ncbi:MAG: hypothetical protein ABSD57_14760 [Verrucomicrobiota bacterium]|jgi:hypothetical protein
MKKLIITMLALAAGATVGYSQGVITIANHNSAFFISTNGSSIGEGTGVASEENVSAFRFDVLDSTVALPQSAANLFLLSNQELWTDSGVTGVSSILHRGGIAAPGAGEYAANWGAPTGSLYSTGPTDWYIVVGWSANLGTTWPTVELNLDDPGFLAGLTSTAWFGTSSVAYNEAGGGPDSLVAVPVLYNSAFTGLAGSGLTSGFDLYPVPEPCTLALAGLGGLSLLLLRVKVVSPCRPGCSTVDSQPGSRSLAFRSARTKDFSRRWCRHPR